MSQPAQVRVVLELDADSEVIQGSISSRDARQEFFGWLELASELEHARKSARSDLFKALQARSLQN